MSYFKSWRTKNPHAFPANEEHVWEKPTQIFDNLYYIGNNVEACYLLTTTDGLILLDCMQPKEIEKIEQSIVELGFDPKDLKYVLITHGHFDHYGSSVKFREKYGTKLMMSKIDEEYAKDTTVDRPDWYPILWYDMDAYYADGGSVKLGDNEIETYFTPGHSPGCFSFIFKVYDEGREHMGSIWGGTGLRRTKEENRMLLDSCYNFARICLDRNVDCTVANHPFLDNTLLRLEVVRNIVDGVPHPFVYGIEGYQRFMRELCKFYAAWFEKN